MSKIVKVMNNKPVTATVGGKKCYFRSKLEYGWAQYLEFLKRSGEIRDWFYEKTTFDFQGKGYAKGPFMYLMDFTIIDKDGQTYYQECKGHHDGQTNSKLKRVADCYPDAVVELVLQNIPANGIKGANRRATAKRYTRRIIDAGFIFRQLRGVIKVDAPKLKL